MQESEDKDSEAEEIIRKMDARDSEGTRARLTTVQPSETSEALSSPAGQDSLQDEIRKKRLEKLHSDKKMEHIAEHEEDESKALISDLSDLTSASTSRRQLDAGTLDAKVVKALKKREEKREKRASRKKEV